MRTNNRKPTYRKGTEQIQPLPPVPESFFPVMQIKLPVNHILIKGVFELLYSIG